MKVDGEDGGCQKGGKGPLKPGTIHPNPQERLATRCITNQHLKSKVRLRMRIAKVRW